MAIVVPQRRQKEGTLDKIAKALQIGTSLLGSGMDVARYIEQKKMNQFTKDKTAEQMDMQRQEQQRAERGQQANIGLHYTKDAKGDTPIGEDTFSLRDPNTSKTRLPQAYEVFSKPGLKVSSKPFPGGIEQKLEDGRTIYLTDKPEEGPSLTPDKYVKTYLEVSENTPGAEPIAVKYYDGKVKTKYSVAKDTGGAQAVDPNDVLGNIDKYEKAVLKYFDSGFSDFAQVPFVGKTIGKGVQAAGQLPPVTQEMITTGTGTLQKLVRLFQGGRPSDFDYLIAQKAFEIKFGESKSMSLAKLSALKEMMKSYVEAREKGRKPTMMDATKQVAVGMGIMNKNQFDDAFEKAKKDHPQEYKEWQEKNEAGDNLSHQQAEEF